MPRKKSASKPKKIWLVSHIQQFWRFVWPKIRAFYAQHKILKIISIIIGSILILAAILAFIFRPSATHKIQRVGVSFSVKYAQELGIDWQEAYMALLDDIDINYLRLMSNWDRHEPVDDQFNFEELDWQMDRAHEAGARVSLAIGLRQPRWPECHYPDWAKRMPREEWHPKLMEYLEVVVNRYKHHPALMSYQLENEALNHWFGECFVHDRAHLKEDLAKEFELVKSLDSQHPVVMSLSDQHGLPAGEPTPDIYGYSVYRVVYNTQIAKGYFVYPTPVWYHRMRAWIIDVLKDRPILVHELQLEPWGPAPTPQLSIPEQDKSMDVQQMYENVDFARQIGLDEAYLWGAEWWYWRKTVLEDPDPWVAAKDIVRQINKQLKFTIPETETRLIEL